MARLYGAIVLLLIEMLFLSILVDAATISRNTILGTMLANSGNILRWSIVSAGLLTLYFTQTKRWAHNNIIETRSFVHVSGSVLIHLVFYIATVVTTVSLFQSGTAITSFQGVLWFSLTFLTALRWCLIITGTDRWKRFLIKESWALLSAGVCSLGIVIVGTYFQRFWEVLNVFTLTGTKLVLELIYDNLYFDFAEKKLGVPEFWVYVDSACSGIEGIVVAVATTAIYLFLSRDQLRFPHSLALIPIACLFSVVLNVLRIATLIVIGIEYSPKLAVEGFHSVAGWLAAVAVALIIIFVFSSWKWLQTTNDGVTSQQIKTGESLTDSNLAIAILAPFAVFIGLTLFGRIFTSGFDYFYPIKISLTTLTLVELPDNYQNILSTGVAAAIVWVLLVKHQPDIDAGMSESITQMSTLSATIWIIWRTLSFWIVVPIFEELLFRGYLLSRIAGQEIDNNKKIQFRWAALIVTAILFGLIHDAWLAGFVTGLMFAWLRFKSTSITSCIFAHSLTNFLVSIWAFNTAQWSLI